MKIILKPREGATFTPADLRAQLDRWVQADTKGFLTARYTLSGKIREITLDLDGDVEATPNTTEAST